MQALNTIIEEERVVSLPLLNNDASASRFSNQKDLNGNGPMGPKVKLKNRRVSEIPMSDYL